MENITNISLFLDDNYFEQETTPATFTADESLKRTIKLVFCTIYVILFVIGSVGNGYVIIMLANILSLLSSKTSNNVQRLNAFGTTHMFIYVLGLSIVDFCVILHLPMLVFEIIEGQWVFGTVLCKVYWMGESVNKLLSSFLMTVLSWDRFLAVCSPIKSLKFRNDRVAIIVLFTCATLAILLLSPVLINSNAKTLHKPTGLSVEELRLKFPEIEIDDSEVVKKCIFDIQFPAIFTFCTFIIGFVMPSLFISYFYLRVILRLRASANNVRKHSDSFTNSSNSMSRFHKVTHRVVAIVLFYFISWLPYWTLNIALNFQILITSLPQLAISALFFSAHILVCFNSAANPILYALINRELRHQHNQAMMKRRRSNPGHLNAQRIQSDKPSALRDSPSDYFNTQRRHQSFHHHRHSESSFDSNVYSFTDRCRARVSLPQTKLSRSLLGLRTMMTFAGRTPPASKRISIKRDLRSNSFSQPSFSTAISQMPESSNLIEQSNPDFNQNKVTIIVQEFD